MYVGVGTEAVKSRLWRDPAKTASRSPGGAGSQNYVLRIYLVYKEVLETKTEARKRENQIKRYKGGRAFKKLIGVGTEAVKRS